MSRRKIIECKGAAAAEADSSDFFIDTCVASSLAVEKAKAAAASEDHFATRAAVAKTPKKKKAIKAREIVVLAAAGDAAQTQSYGMVGVLGAGDAAQTQGDGMDIGLHQLYSLEADCTAQAESENQTATQAAVGDAAPGTGVFHYLLNKK